MKYEGPDERPQDEQERFKVDFFFTVLDIAIAQVKERVTQLKQHNELFGFLYNIKTIDKFDSSELLNKCRILDKSLQHEEQKDIDAAELFDELKALCRSLPKALNPYEVLVYLSHQKLNGLFPNVQIALRVLLSLPISVASGERSFSKLKLIKTYLRSTMTQDRLVGLATISIEHELASSLDMKSLISDFAKAKARRIRLD